MAEKRRIRICPDILGLLLVRGMKVEAARPSWAEAESIGLPAQ